MSEISLDDEKEGREEGKRKRRKQKRRHTKREEEMRGRELTILLHTEGTSAQEMMTDRNRRTEKKKGKRGGCFVFTMRNQTILLHKRKKRRRKRKRKRKRKRRKRRRRRRRRRKRKRRMGDIFSFLPLRRELLLLFRFLLFALISSSISFFSLSIIIHFHLKTACSSSSCCAPH